MKFTLSKIILSAALLATPLAALLAVPVAQSATPALPDTERRTRYVITASAGPLNVSFDLYGDGTDYAQWIEVWVDGVKLTAVTDWTLDSPSGSLATIARPITNARITFAVARTGTVDIAGARRPRRTTQFNEGAAISAATHNRTYTDIVAENREAWDKFNRTITAPPGDVMTVLPPVATRAGRFLTFDSSGNPIATSPTPGLGNVLGPVSAVVGNMATWGNTSGTLLQDGGPPGGHAITSPATPTYAVTSADANKLIESGAAGGTLTTTLPTPASLPVGFTIGFARNGGNSHVINTTAANIALPTGPSGGGGYVATMTLGAENEVIWLTLDASANWRPSGGTAQPTVPFVYPHVTAVTGITYGHQIPWLDANVQFGGAGVYPVSIISPMPFITGKAGSSIGSSTPGQIFSIRFQWAANDITRSYTAIGGDTTATIAAGLCTAVAANATITNPITGLPILCQSFAGSAVFNLQYDAALSATGATPLTTTSTGTGTVTLAGEANSLDFTAIELGRAVPGRAGRAGDALVVLDFTGQSTTALRDTHYGNMGVFVDVPTAGAQRGSFVFSTAQDSGPAFGRLKIGQGLVLYNAVQAQAFGGDLGPGTINVPSTGSMALNGTNFVLNTGIFPPSSTVFGGTAAGSVLNLTSTSSGAPSGDAINFLTGGVGRWVINSAGHLHTGTTNVFDIGAGGALPRNIIAGTSVVTPIVYGGSATTSTLQLRSTSGVGDGTNDRIILATGNNGANPGIRVINSRVILGMASIDPVSQLHARMAADQNVIFSGPITLGTGTSLLSRNDANSVSLPLEFLASRYHLGGGNVGLGAAATPDALLTIMGNTAATVAPTSNTAYLHVVGADANSANILIDVFGTGTNPGFIGRRANGTLAAKTGTVNTDILVAMAGQGWDTTTYGTAGGMQLRAIETWGAAAHGSLFAIRTVAAGATTVTDSLLVQNTGVVALGYVATTPTTVGALPACAAGLRGARWFVTDGNTANAFRGAVTAGGALNQWVVCDGAAWLQGANDNMPAHLVRKFA